MKERSILFSAEMIRAILDGRKSQTRRVIRPQPIFADDGECWYPSETHKKGLLYGSEISFRRWLATSFSPYGQPGDRLWVRETWGIGTRPCPFNGWVDGIEYKADELLIDDNSDLTLYLPVNLPDDICLGDYEKKGWTPSIHMPRWASRIMLEITGVRVERVQEISEEDAQAEGVERPILRLGPNGSRADNEFEHWPIHPLTGEYKDAYRTLWDKLNAKRGFGWDINPWAWVLEFKVVKP